MSTEEIPAIAICGSSKGERVRLIEGIAKHFKGNNYAVEICWEAPASGKRSRLLARSAEQATRHALITSITAEDRARRKLAHSKKPLRLLLVEQGVMGGAAYADQRTLFSLWKAFGCNPVWERDTRYRGVIVLGHPETDVQQLPAWTGCPHLAYLPLALKPAEKLAMALRWAASFTCDVEIERSWRLTQPIAISDLPSGARKISITQQYIRDPHAPKRERIRKRGENGEFAYFRSLKRRLHGNERGERERVISAIDYANLETAYACTLTAPVRKDRWCFVENNLYWEFDQFQDFVDEKTGVLLQKLEVEMPYHDYPVPYLPSFASGNAQELVGKNHGYGNGDIATALKRSEQKLVAA